MSINHSLNGTLILQHPALAVRWWKHDLGGAGGRGSALVSGESHPDPATRLHATTAFVVAYLQAETTGDAEQTKGLRAVVPAESVQKKPGLEEAAVTGMSGHEPKAGAIPSFVWGRSQPLSVPHLLSGDSAC